MYCIKEEIIYANKYINEIVRGYCATVSDQRTRKNATYY